MVRELSPRGQAVLKFVGGFQSRWGYAPTVREVRDGVRLSSTSVATYQLRGLQNRGLLTAGRPGMARTIGLTPEGAEALALLTEVAVGSQVSQPVNLADRGCQNCRYLERRGQSSVSFLACVQESPGSVISETLVQRGLGCPRWGRRR